MKCKQCGKEFESIYPRQTHCSVECSYQSKLVWQREYHNKKVKPKRKQAVEVKKEKKVRKQASLVDMAVAARAAGLSYGQYVAMQNVQNTKIIRKADVLHG